MFFSWLHKATPAITITHMTGDTINNIINKWNNIKLKIIYFPFSLVHYSHVIIILFLSSPLHLFRNPTMKLHWLIHKRINIGDLSCDSVWLRYFFLSKSGKRKAASNLNKIRHLSDNLYSLVECVLHSASILPFCLDLAEFPLVSTNSDWLDVILLLSNKQDPGQIFETH